MLICSLTLNVESLNISISEERALEEREAAANQIIDDMIDNQIREIAAEEITSTAACEQGMENLLEEVLHAESRLVAASALAEAAQSIQDRSDRLAERIRRQQLRRCFRSWSEMARKSGKQRKALLTFPSAPGGYDLAEQNRRMGIAQQHMPRSLSQVIVRRAGWEQQMRAAEQKESARLAAILEPFNLVSLIEKSPLGKQIRRK